LIGVNKDGLCAGKVSKSESRESSMRIAFFAFVAMVFIAVECHAQDEDRGRVLHDTYCVMCHDARIYTREDRIARDYRDIRGEVRRWAVNIGMKWDDADVERVATHIATKYYRLSCPDQC
jgi:hypothetical protein